MNEDINKSLSKSWQALKGTFSKLYKDFPNFVFIIFFLLFIIIVSIGVSGFSAQFILSVFLSIISISIYISKKSVTEAVLTLLLGMLTIYSINWDIKTASLSFLLLFSTIIIISMISSIKIASEVETIKIQASNFINDNLSQKERIKRIDQIIKMTTKYEQLSIKDRVFALRYFVFLNIALDDIEKILPFLEVIKVIYILRLEEALEFFASFYFVFMKSEKRHLKESDLDNLVFQLKKTPMIPNDVISIFTSTSGIIVHKEITISEYFKSFNVYVSEGYNKEMIIEKFNSEYT